MRVVFAGTPEVAVPALDALHASAHELVGVVTRPDAPSGRVAGSWPARWRCAPRSSACPSSSPSTRATRSSRPPAGAPPDACPVVAYGALLPQSALDIPEHGWINLHFSILPAWRGAAPVQHSIWAGDEMTGATTFRIVKELDAGPTYGVMTERIRPPTPRATCSTGWPRAAPPCWSAPSTASRTARWRRASSRPTASAWRPRSSSTTPASTGPTRPSASTGRSAPAPPARAHGPRGRASASRSGASPSRPTASRLEPGVLEVTKNAVYVGTATDPSSWARSRRSARSRCGRPTGPGRRRARGRRPARLTHPGVGCVTFQRVGR